MVQAPFSPRLLVIASLLFLAGILASCQERRISEVNNSMSPTATIAPILQGRGVLYIRDEYFQASGLSVIFLGEFQPLTTYYEWWFDPEEAYRFYRKTTELHPDGLHLVGVDGSDGTTGYWRRNREAGMQGDEYTEGRPFPGEEFTFEGWLNIFIRGGRMWIEAWRSGSVEEIDQINHPRFGPLVVLKKVSEEGLITTASVRIEEPHLVVEEVNENSPGDLWYTEKLVDWEWLESGELPENFWMTPPGVEVEPIP